MKPNLFIVGAAKCGTTAWYEYLRSHPDIFFPSMKEPNHFSSDRPCQNRIADLDEYLRLFKNSGSAKIVAEASPAYLFSKTAAENIRGFDPDAKIIAFVRDQEDFLVSRHRQLIYSGRETITDFREVWNMSVQRDALNIPNHLKHDAVFDYRAAGLFNEQLDRYYSRFPADQIRVFHYKDWTIHPRKTYLEILRFMGLEDDGRTTFAPVNEAKRRRGKLLVRLIHNPPAPALAFIRFGRKVTGRSRLGIGNWLSKFDSRPANKIAIDEQLKAEIQAYYRPGNEKLAPRIWSAPSE